MHISCETNILKAALDKVSNAVSSRSVIPILSNILFNAAGDTLDLTASNMDMGITCSVNVNVIKDGSITCPAGQLSKVINNLDSGIVYIEQTNIGTLVVSNEKSRFELPTQPSDEYPLQKQPEDGVVFSMPCKNFADMISKAGIAAADSQESRPIMVGIFMKFEPDRLIMASTDGKRLAKMETQLPLDENRNAELVVKASDMEKLTKIVGSGEGDIEICPCKSRLFVKVSGISFYCLILEGQYPDYNKVIPSKFQRTAQLSREMFIKALNSAIIMANDKDSPNLVRFSFEQDKLVLSSNTAGLGSAQVEIPVFFEGEPLTISFNGSFILQALKVFDTDDVEMKLQDEIKSSVLRPFHEENYSYVCMPVRSRI
ncbi:MAG: DNA polymerase III subunit beta [bacterium]|nr:DNA polymerase III subunit beta [bacterium]